MMLALSRGVCNVLTRIAIGTATRTATKTNHQTIASFHWTGVRSCKTNEAGEAVEAAAATPEPGETEVDAPAELSAADLKRIKNDRTKVIPVETSIRYLKSAAYKTTYGERFVWEQYRRNHKGMFPPRKTRKTCIRAGAISTGNPCPICRDEYLVLDEHNVDLLRQFISPQTGKILSYSKTGLCQKTHFQLRVAVERAYDYGLITFEVPFREYDYSEYYDKDTAQRVKGAA